MINQSPLTLNLLALIEPNLPPKKKKTKPTYTKAIALNKKEISCRVFLFIVKITDPKTTNC